MTYKIFVDYERELCASVQEEVMPWDLVDVSAFDTI